MNPISKPFGQGTKVNEPLKTDLKRTSDDQKSSSRRFGFLRSPQLLDADEGALMLRESNDDMESYVAAARSTA